MVGWHCGGDWTNRPLLFRDRISNCTNLFRPEPNRTTHADPCSLPWITHAIDQRCADPEMLHPHQSADSDHRSASPLPTQAPSRSRVSNPSEPGKLGHWRTINGCSCGAWSLGDSDRTCPSALYYSICSLCSAGQLAECRAWVNDPCQSASANYRWRAVRVSPRISRILADRRLQAEASAVRTSLPQTAVAVRAAIPASRVARQHDSHLMLPPHLPPRTRNTRSQRPHKTRPTHALATASRRDDQFGTSKDTASDRCDTELKLLRLSIWVFQAANDRRWDNYRRTALFVQRRAPCWLLSVVCARR